MITYKLGNTVRHKLINYKETVNSIFVDEVVTFSLNTDNCDCGQSRFCDPHRKHIITGDLRSIDNAILRKLMTKGPNYREPRTLNFNKAVDSINSAIDSYIEDISSKTNLPKESFSTGKEELLSKVKTKIKKLKNQELHNIKLT